MMVRNTALFLAMGVLGHTLTGISACESNVDDDGDGYTSDIDCDDADALIYPGAPETCDGLDNDCDGAADEGLALISYPDADGDGYGSASATASCKSGAGTSANHSDCNDANVAIYPGAPDTIGDGVDKSCDGDDGLAPSVGLTTSTFTTLQAALDAAKAGQTVWVGPGTYPAKGLSMKGKALKLASTQGESKTTIDGQSQGTVIYFTAGEQAGSILQGFTVKGGVASCNLPTGKTPCRYSGGGFFIDNASPTLQDLIVTGNTATSTEYYSGGGGLYLWTASPTLTNVTISGNSAYSGGGVEMWSSSAKLKSVVLQGNTVTGGSYSIGGGGMYVTSSSPTLEDVVVRNNEAGFGGGLYLNYSTPTLKSVRVFGNTAYSQDGAGLYLEHATATLTQVEISNNIGTGLSARNSNPILTHVNIFKNATTKNGGGMYLYNASPSMTHVAIWSNASAGNGGGIYLAGGYPTMNQVALVGNEADYNGGGFYLYAGFPTLKNSIVAFNCSNVGGNLFRDYLEPINSVVTATYSDLYNPTGWARDNIDATGSFVSQEPGFTAYADRHTGETCSPGSLTSCIPANLHLALSSPLINAGDTAVLDADSSRSDMGVYGGPLGGSWDLDVDGLPDYFWPGAWADAPTNFASEQYDCDDHDPTVRGC